MPERFHAPPPETPEQEPPAEAEAESTEAKSDPTLTRRELLIGAGAVAAELLLPEEAEAAPSRARRCTTGALAGRTFTDLYTAYTGIDGVVPKEVRVDFANRLRTLWERKERRAPENPVVDRASRELVTEYETRDPVRMRLPAYRNEVTRALREVRRDLNAQDAADILGLSASERTTTARIATSWTAEDFIAYSLTELMPSSDGTLNTGVLDFLLQNAGARYVYSIPALYDDRTSFGPYQFTSYALYEGPDGPRGASRLASALAPGSRIPGSVIDLRGRDHHKAAYLFAYTNLATLVRSLPESHRAKLEKGWRSHRDEILQYIATSHHLPGIAKRNAERWIANGMRTPYVASCGPRLRQYAKKTQANRQALRKIFRA